MQVMFYSKGYLLDRTFEFFRFSNDIFSVLVSRQTFMVTCKFVVSFLAIN